MKVCIIAFNLGNSNGFVNGPGMSLLNFVKFLKKHKNCNISIYTQLRSSEKMDNVSINKINLSNDLKSEILSSDIIHCWSGLTDVIHRVMLFAKKNNKKIFLGPNLIDTVNAELERKFLNTINPKRLFVVNKKLKIKASNVHDLSIDNISEIIVGPDTDIWRPPEKYSDQILWKGNSSHKVKDIGFGLKIAERLDKYKFLFLGHPNPYSYKEHIDTARSCYLYYTTSISETKGMAVLEQLSAGVPCITHPNIFQSGINYKTGIITKRNIDSYCEAIEEIMENSSLRESMSEFSSKYIKETYDSKKLIQNVVKYYLED